MRFRIMAPLDTAGVFQRRRPQPPQTQENPMRAYISTATGYREFVDRRQAMDWILAEHSAALRQKTIARWSLWRELDYGDLVLDYADTVGTSIFDPDHLACPDHPNPADRYPLHPWPLTTDRWGHPL